MFIPETLLDIVFPPVCVACERRIAPDEPYRAVCTDCFASIPLRRGLIRAADFPFMLGDLLYEYVSANAAEFPALVSATGNFLVAAIPLSHRRERVRGYNQAELIARCFAERAGLRVAPQLLARARHTSPQSETMSVAERRENLRDAFAADVAVAGAHILLVDDVATTGATLGEAVRVLETSGAARIITLAAAKT